MHKDVDRYCHTDYTGLRQWLSRTESDAYEAKLMTNFMERRIHELSDDELIRRGFNELDIYYFRSGHPSRIDMWIECLQDPEFTTVAEERERGGWFIQKPVEP